MKYIIIFCTSDLKPATKLLAMCHLYTTNSLGENEHYRLLFSEDFFSIRTHLLKYLKIVHDNTVTNDKTHWYAVYRLRSVNKLRY